MAKRDCCNLEHNILTALRLYNNNHVVQFLGNNIEMGLGYAGDTILWCRKLHTQQSNTEKDGKTPRAIQQ